MENNDYSSALNDQQAIMLRLLKKPLPEEDFVEMRRLAVKLLAKQLDTTVEKWESENNITTQAYEERSGDHFRTPSKPK
jgi:hypothetical protein